MSNKDNKESPSKNNSEGLNGPNVNTKLFKVVNKKNSVKINYIMKFIIKGN